MNNFSGTDRRLHVWDLSKIGKLGKLDDSRCTVTPVCYYLHACTVHAIT
jgi:hypothetical protein